MLNIPDKVNGDFYLPDELTQFKNETQGAIVSSGQVLTSGVVDQLTKALAVYAAGGEFYTAGGTVSAVTLTPIGLRIAPPTYTDGQSVSWISTGASTGATTVDVAGLGVKNLFFNGVATVADIIAANTLVTARYSLSNDRFDVVTDPNMVNTVGINTLSGPLVIGDDAPIVRVIDTDALADETTYEVIVDGGELVIRTVTDALGVGEEVVRITRTGTGVDVVNIVNGLLQVNGADVWTTATFTPSGQRQATLQHSATQVVTTTGYKTISLDTTVSDTDGFVSGSTFVIPNIPSNPITAVRLTGTVRLISASPATFVALQFTKNASTLYTGYASTSAPIGVATNANVTLTSGLIPCTAGDVFAMEPAHDAGVNKSLDGLTQIQFQVVAA